MGMPKVRLIFLHWSFTENTIMNDLILQKAFQCQNVFTFYSYKLYNTLPVHVFSILATGKHEYVIFEEMWLYYQGFSVILLNSFINITFGIQIIMLLCYGRWQVHNILDLASLGLKYSQIELGSSNDQSCLIDKIDSSWVFFPPSHHHHRLEKMQKLTVKGFCIVLMKRTWGKSHDASGYRFAAGHRQMGIYLELSCCG